MLTYIQETTKNFKADYRVPLHTYIMEGEKCVGYIKEGTEQEVMFSQPLKKFDKRGRTFKKVKV